MKKLILLLIIFTMSAEAQRKVSIAAYQDAKLAVLGDKERGYDAFTLNIITRLKMQGNQQKFGYMIVYHEFEYADIDGIYKRYSANIGYTFNKLVLDNFEASIQGGWGFIDRYSTSFFSFSGGGEFAYKINDRFKLSLLAQWTERKDLKYIWGDNVIRFSGFFGIEYNFN